MTWQHGDGRSDIGMPNPMGTMARERWHGDVGMGMGARRGCGTGGEKFLDVAKNQVGWDLKF